MTQMRDTERLLRERIRELEEQLKAKERLLDLASAMGHSLEEQYEEMKAAVDVWKTDALNWERHARENYVNAKQLEEQLEAVQRDRDGYLNAKVDLEEQLEAKNSKSSSDMEAHS